MLISKIGEFGLIKRFQKLIKTDSSVVKASGDDCAVVKFDRDNYQLLTCDMLIENVDFTKKTDPYLIGRKALAVSLSDIAACGGTPRYALVSLGLPKNSTVELAQKLCKGMADLAARFKVNIVGGDLSRAERLTIDVSMVGVVKKKRLVLRSGAKKNDIIFVTAGLGGSIYGKHLTFTPRLKEANYLVSNYKINSMIDISDGLAQDLNHILEASSVGAVIYESLIPLNKEARNLNDALFSGEDFELLFTVPLAEAKKLRKNEGHIFHMIGEITDKKSGLRLIDKNSRLKKLKARGFTHF